MSTNPDADVYMPENERYYGPAVPLEAGRMYPYRLPDEKFNRIWLEKIKEVIDLYSPDVLYFDSRAFIITEEYRYRMLEYYYLETGHERDHHLQGRGLSAERGEYLIWKGEVL